MKDQLKKDEAWIKFIEKNGNHLFDEYCMLWERKEHADLMVKTHGELVASPNGFPVVSPWLAVGNKCRSEILNIFKLVHGEGIKRSAGSTLGKKEIQEEKAIKAATKGKFAPSAAPLRIAK